jgi:RNA polymerase sigma factor (TIGR02999 family)
MSEERDRGEVTRLLAEAAGGGREALDRVVPLVYDELRRLAHRRLTAERPDHTLDTTALVHETYLELVDLDRIAWRSRGQFFAIAARVMRRVLVDYAVSRKAQKRGGGAVPIPLDELAELTITADDHAAELLALDAALDRLARIDERQARIVECRFFGGLSIEETAATLDISPATVKRDWTLARAWLNREVGA